MRARHGHCVRIRIHMLPNQNEAFGTIAALGVWELVWAGLELLVVEMRDVLGSHLRERPIALRRLPSDGRREAAELRIGRTRLRLECPLRCAGAAPEEAFFADA